MGLITFGNAKVFKQCPHIVHTLHRKLTYLKMAKTDNVICERVWAGSP